MKQPYWCIFKIRLSCLFLIEQSEGIYGIPATWLNHKIKDSKSSEEKKKFTFYTKKWRNAEAMLLTQLPYQLQVLIVI